MYLEVFIGLLLLPVFKWWWNAIAKKPSDTYAGDDNLYSMIFIPASVFTIPLLLGSILAFSSPGPIKVEPIMIIPIMIVAYFGGVTYILAIARMCGIDYTKVGKILGIYPPTEKFLPYR